PPSCLHAPATTVLATLSLHAALPILHQRLRVPLPAPCAGRTPLRGSGGDVARAAARRGRHRHPHHPAAGAVHERRLRRPPAGRADRKSTRLNSSHVKISYAVLCLKKK